VTSIHQAGTSGGAGRRTGDDRSRSRGEGAEADTARPTGPLSGITVVDLTRVLAGPYCTMVMADLGARVIKVEQPGSGDDSRAFGPFLKGVSAYFLSLNRGKESIALDLKTPPDRAIFESLLAQADVLVENYRPGTMEKLGYGWETLHPRYPRLIYAAASGFGHTGPYAKRAAYDMVVQAMGGIMSITGHPGQPPVRVGTSIGDITAGLFATIGVNAALLHRATTGEAIKVDVAMLDCQLAILENAISRYAATGEVAGPIGARHPSITPFAGFEAKDGWMVIAAGNDNLFQKLCQTIEAPRLAADSRFVTNALRTENWAPLFDEMGRALKRRPVAEWLARLDAAGVPCGPINTIDKVLADPHVRARNMVVTANDPATGPLMMAGNPIKLSGFADPDVRRPAPALDADRARILEAMPAAAPSTAVALAPEPAPGPVPGPTPGPSGAMRLFDQILRGILRATPPPAKMPSEAPFAERAQTLADALLSERGEVLGTVIANDLVQLVRRAGGAERYQLLQLFARRYGPDMKRVSAAAERWKSDPSGDTFAALSAAIESPRQELFRRMNMAPDGTVTLVKLREHLLAQLSTAPDLKSVDADLRHLFGSWFNRGFLELERISWNTPAAILEKLIAYEAVHAIDGWDDLRRRLQSDRRCFGFFHPALPNEPLIFVEVALVDELSDRVEPILRAPVPAGETGPRKVAVFYSISNCQPGLKGVSFGNFLIKQVATSLKQELPSLETFATLSPIPGFRAWLASPSFDIADHVPADLAERMVRTTGRDTPRAALAHLEAEASADGYKRAGMLRDVMVRLAARYLAGQGSDTGPTDPVARFHLGNGARIERVNWMADLSKKGIRESHGLMVNYVYDLQQTEVNHEAFANRRPVAVSKAVEEQLADATRGAGRGKTDPGLGLFGKRS